MYATLNWGWRPRKFARLSQKEKALVVQFINEKLDAEKKQQAKMKAAAKKKGR